MGNVGTPLIHALFGKGVKRTVASDVDPAGRAVRIFWILFLCTYVSHCIYTQDSIRKEFLGHDFTLRVVGKDDMSILFEGKYVLVSRCCPKARLQV